MSGVKRNLKDEIEEGLDNIPLITVSKMKEHEDGGATFDIETSPEATRMLVEIGLTALLEKVIDKENEEYSYHTEPMSQELIDALDKPVK